MCTALRWLGRHRRRRRCRRARARPTNTSRQRGATAILAATSPGSAYIRRMTCVIGLDSSTTATKAVAWNREGRAVADGRGEFSLALPRPGWHEQDPEDWWRSTASAVRRALRSVDGADVEAIGLTHQRETFACLDEHGRAVRPAIVWMDVRSVHQVEQLGS